MAIKDWATLAALCVCLFNCAWFVRLAFAFLDDRAHKQFALSVAAFVGSAMVVLVNLPKLLL